MERDKIFRKLTNFKVRGIKIVLNTSRVKDWNEIDAIGISQSEIPIKATINLAKSVLVIAPIKKDTIQKLYFITKDVCKAYTFTKAISPLLAVKDKTPPIIVTAKDDNIKYIKHNNKATLLTPIGSLGSRERIIKLLSVLKSVIIVVLKRHS